jgi:hypothetical protein
MFAELAEISGTYVEQRNKPPLTDLERWALLTTQVKGCARIAAFQA